MVCVCIVDMTLYHGESWELMQRRWGKLIKDFWLNADIYDISKIPDIYDCIKYDLQHNMKILRFNEAEELHTLAKAMADIVIPQASFSSSFLHIRLCRVKKIFKKAQPGEFC